MCVSVCDCERLLCVVFARRRQFHIRSQTTDRLLHKLSDDSRPQSVVFYDHVTLCQRHRQEHLEQQQQYDTSSSLYAFPLLTQPRQHLQAVASTACRTANIPRAPRSIDCAEPVVYVTRNPVTSSLTSSCTLECDDCDEGRDIRLWSETSTALTTPNMASSVAARPSLAGCDSRKYFVEKCHV